MRNSLYRPSILLFFSLAVLAACSPGAAGTTQASKPVVIISAPPSGSVFHEGDQITVQSTATDSTAVVRVELLVDGATVTFDSTPNAQGQPTFSVSQKWLATPGTHTIVVRAVNASGTVSDLAGISISVLPAVSTTPNSAPTLSVLASTVTPQLPTFTPIASTTPLATSPTTAATPCAKPQIGSFTIDPGELKRGDSATLNWGAVTNANSAVIDNGVGGVPTPGSRSVRPDKKTTYTLTATGCGGTSSTQVTVEVFALGAGQPGIPQGTRPNQKHMQFDWSNRSEFDDKYLSGIDIETNRGGSYQPFESAANFDFGNYENKKAFEPGKYKVRFRWWLIDRNTKQRVSLKGQWSVICFDFGPNEQCR
ncbi:MAG TPA: Ig-like domain-containing protein [Anaerolineae bacterium]